MTHLTTRVLCLALVLCASSATGDSRTVPARDLPVPPGASDALQAAIAAAGGNVNINARAAVVPTTEAEWRAIIEARDLKIDGFLEAQAAQFKTHFERSELAGVAIHRVTPDVLAPDAGGRVLLYLHGGAYVFGGGDMGAREALVIAAQTGLPVVSVDYRMPPDHPHPAAVDDAVAVYRELLKQHDPRAIAVGGTSAGGGLALALVHKLKQSGLAVPGALYLGTPWTDLTAASDSLWTNEGVDRFLVTYNGMLKACAELYAAGTDLRDPLLSPVYGDFSGFPPAYFVTGTRDMLLSDSARVHRKLRAAGVQASLNVYEGISHAEYAALVGTPEWQQAYGEMRAFLEEHLAATPGAAAVGVSAGSAAAGR